MKKLNLLLAAALLVCAACGQQSQKLEYKLTEGETYRQNIKMEMLQKLSMMGQNMEIKMQMEFGMASTVAEVKPDGYVLSTAYTKMAMNTEIPGMGSVGYSSDENAPVSAGMEQLSALLKSMTNAPFTLEISKRGEPLRATGLSALVDQMTAEVDPGDMEQIKATIAQQFSDEAFINQYKQITCVYPEKALAVGDSWTQKGTVKTTMNMDMETTYTVKSISAETVVLDIASTITVEEQGMEVQGLVAMVNMKGTQTGTNTIDARTGWPVAGNMEQAIKGTMEMQGMQVPMEIKTTITLDNK